MLFLHENKIFHERKRKMIDKVIKGRGCRNRCLGVRDLGIKGLVKSHENKLYDYKPSLILSRTLRGTIPANSLIAKNLMGIVRWVFFGVAFSVVQ
jgi:hypothetical protein